MTGKIRLGVIFGGRSGEHEVSVRSARSVVEAADREKYEVVSPPSVESLPLVESRTQAEDHWHRQGKGKA